VQQCIEMSVCLIYQNYLQIIMQTNARQVNFVKAHIVYEEPFFSILSTVEATNSYYEDINSVLVVQSLHKHVYIVYICSTLCSTFTYLMCLPPHQSNILHRLLISNVVFPVCLRLSKHKHIFW
jgi:hypothetical protein